MRSGSCVPFGRRWCFGSQPLAASGLLYPGFKSLTCFKHSYTSSHHSTRRTTRHSHKMEQFPCDYGSENVVVPCTYSDLKLAGMAWGPVEAQIKILALHGWVDNAGTWSRFVPLFLKKWEESLSPSDRQDPTKLVRFISLDLPGHGHSDHRPGNVVYHNVDYIPDVISFADGLGWDKFYIFGHSLGAAVATVVACTVPDRVKGLVVVEGFGPWVGSEESFISNLRSAIQKNPEIFASERPVYPGYEAAVERLGKNLPELKKESLRALVSRGVKEVEGGVVFRHDKKLKCTGHQRITERQVAASLKELECKSLLVVGKEGFYNAKPDLYNFAKFIEARRALVESFGKTKVDMQFISGGHHCHLDYPEEMVDSVISLLRS